jgi:hypothetical protein
MGSGKTEPKQVLVSAKSEEDLDEEKQYRLEQITGVLMQAEVGVPVAEVIRKAGIREQTISLEYFHFCSSAKRPCQFFLGRSRTE